MAPPEDTGSGLDGEAYLALRVLARPRVWVGRYLSLVWRRRLAVGVGGALGTGLRLVVSAAVPAVGGWPWATLAENVSGSLLLGYLLARFLLAAPRTTLTIPLLCTGVLGSYTTFSTFAVEIAGLTGQGRPLLAAGYALTSLVAGVAAAQAGIRLAERRR